VRSDEFTACADGSQQASALLRSLNQLKVWSTGKRRALAVSGSLLLLGVTG
jgi:hypothetical protein